MKTQNEVIDKMINEPNYFFIKCASTKEKREIVKIIGNQSEHFRIYGFPYLYFTDAILLSCCDKEEAFSNGEEVEIITGKDFLELPE